MFKRIQYVIKGRSKQLLKRIENPIQTLKLAKDDLFKRAVECQSKAEKLKRKGIEDEMVTQLIERLEKAASDYKRKYHEVEKKIDVLEAKKVAAEAMLEIIKFDKGLLSGSGDPLSVIADIEEDIASIEDEVKAYLKVTEGDQ